MFKHIQKCRCVQLKHFLPAGVIDLTSPSTGSQSYYQNSLFKLLTLQGGSRFDILRLLPLVSAPVT